MGAIVNRQTSGELTRIILTRIIQSLYYAPATSSSESADRGRSIIQVTLRASKPSSSESADRGRSIIQVNWYVPF
jgi:hypothetical protein